MQSVRGRILLLMALAMWGSLAITSGYAWYLRSDRYRLWCAAQLAQAIGLPSELGRVVPRSSTSRQFENVLVWLPDRRGKAFEARHALLTRTPAPHDPLDYMIELFEGRAVISSDTWLRSDYRAVLSGSLRPGFSPAGPRKVVFSDMDLMFQRERVHLELLGAAGEVEFVSPSAATARATCDMLGAFHASQPVYLEARFSPADSGVQIDSLELTVPRMPLSALGLEKLFPGNTRRGEFDGRLAYGERADERTLVASGTCYDLQLADWTEGLLPRPWRGTSPRIELQELRIVNRTPTLLRFRGRLSDLFLEDLLSLWQMDDIGGSLWLEVGEAQLSAAGLDRFVASGRCEDVALEHLTAHLGAGAMTGNLRVVIEDLTIEENRLKSLAATILVDDATDPPNYVEGTLLRELVRRTLNIELPPILPDKIEYTKLGLRIEVQDEQLQIFGSHGAQQRTILTVQLLRREVPLVSAPERVFDLTGWFDDLRAKAGEAVRQRLPFATMPSTAPANPAAPARTAEPR